MQAIFFLPIVQWMLFVVFFKEYLDVKINEHIHFPQCNKIP